MFWLCSCSHYVCSDSILRTMRHARPATRLRSLAAPPPRRVPACCKRANLPPRLCSMGTGRRGVARGNPVLNCQFYCQFYLEFLPQTDVPKMELIKRSYLWACALLHAYNGSSRWRPLSSVWPFAPAVLLLLPGNSRHVHVVDWPGSLFSCCKLWPRCLLPPCCPAALRRRVRYCLSSRRTPQEAVWLA